MCAGVALLTACAELYEDGGATHLHVLNLIEDSALVQFVLDDTVVATENYAAGSEYGPAPSGVHSVHFKAVPPTRLPGDSGASDPSAIGTSVNHEFTATSDYTLIATGTVAQPRALAIGAAEQRERVAETKFDWRIVHASPDAPAVDAYISAPEAGMATPQFIASLPYGGASDPMELTLTAQPDRQGDDPLYVDLTIELRASGTGQVLFNSGEVRFLERSRVLFAIAASTGVAGSELQLVTLSNDGASSILRDPSDPASLRLAHASPETPPLDLERTGSQPVLIAQNVSFGAYSSRVTIPAGPGALEARSSVEAATIFLKEFYATPSQAYSAYGIGPAASVEGVVIADSPRSVPTQAQVRFLHAAGSLAGDAALDVYVTLPGRAVDFNGNDDGDTTDDAATLRRATALAYRNASAYVALPEGSYNLYFARTGGADVVLGPVTVQVTNGSVRTLALTDPQGMLQITAFEDAAG